MILLLQWLIRKEVSKVGDFFNAAFPWVAFSIGLAIVLTYMNSKKKKPDDKEQ